MQTKTDPRLKQFFDNQITEGLAQNLFAGCGVGFLNTEGITTSYSNTLIPNSDKKFSNDTLFDIASITKSIVGLVAIKLIDAGELTLETRINYYLKFPNKSWDRVTLQHLLTNSMQLNITEPIYLYEIQKIKEIIRGSSVTHLGDSYYYHNTTSVVLGWLLEIIFKLPLDVIIKRYVFEPAGMKQSYFYGDIPQQSLSHVTPSVNPKVPVPGIIIGKPHDELAHRFAEEGLVIGCAGIFSTINDLLMLGEHIISKAFSNPRMIRKMLHNFLPHPRTFGLAFDLPAPDYICPCFARSTLVMTGFTGCVIWIQPDHHRVLTILSNITYPDVFKVRSEGAYGLQSTLTQFRKGIATDCFFCNPCLGD